MIKGNRELAKPKLLCCSKKLLVVSYMLAISITVYSFVKHHYNPSMDMTLYITAMSLSWAEVTACNIWYYWKAKCEKKYEFAERILQKYGEMYEADTLVNLIDIITKKES